MNEDSEFDVVGLALLIMFNSVVWCAIGYSAAFFIYS